MSRKGKVPIVLPKGVEVKVQDNKVVVKGPKGTLSQGLVPGVHVAVEAGIAAVTVDGKGRDDRRFHGLYRALLQNMVTGTSSGFEKKLEMVGVGYRAAVQGQILDLQVGTSHDVKLPIPQGIQVKVDKNTEITVTGIDRQVVGQFTAEIRSKKPPEPYQGKGIRGKGEYVRRKAGKAAKTAKK